MCFLNVFFFLMYLFRAEASLARSRYKQRPNRERKTTFKRQGCEFKINSFFFFFCFSNRQENRFKVIHRRIRKKVKLNYISEILNYIYNLLFVYYLKVRTKVVKRETDHSSRYWLNSS